VVPGAGDHGGVVGAELGVRDGDGGAVEAGGEGGAEATVARDPAHDGEAVEAVGLEGALGLADEDVYTGFLEAGAKVGGDAVVGEDGGGAAELLDLAGEGGLEAGEGEVAVVAVEERAWEGEGLRVALLREAVDEGPAGIAEADVLGDLVVGFADGVVEGLAEGFELEGAADEGDAGVSAADGEADIRLPVAGVGDGLAPGVVVAADVG
jgi:hypothetical protein